MSVAGSECPEALDRAARALTVEFATSTPGSGVGYLLLHRARPAHFALAHVWDGVDLIQSYWTSTLDRPAELRPHRAGAVGCVWELEVLAFESAQWAASCEASDRSDRYLGTHL
ncbi:hypothetical protein ACOCJ7_19350 [Knoellia sp. CPCC 206453]|uniref:hypothetical protein n=1 Tax=Knoellia pratensis TaxID=3404796 RepID=UPI0036090A2B